MLLKNPHGEVVLKIAFGILTDKSLPFSTEVFVTTKEVTYCVADLPDGLCPVAPSERQECGHYGITRDECLSKSCCWDPTVPNAKWCFKQPGE